MDYRKEAAKLRERADELDMLSERPLPTTWEVGQRVRFVRDKAWMCSKGATGKVIEVKPESKGISADQYQVFFTSLDGCRGKFWTTPDDVELITEEES